MEKSYYAIIPASVRYDKKLTPNSKLLYGEITALCNEKGYCWANNTYFSTLYKVSNRTITNWINELKGAGHIIVNYERADVEGYSKRYIMLADTNVYAKPIGRKKSSSTP
jgi:hypothetical protein